MAIKLAYGVCSQELYNKFEPIVKKRWDKKPENERNNICTVGEALNNTKLQKHFMYQRAQISSYYQQARKASRKKYGDVVKDVKCLLTPYLFAMADRKPNPKSDGDFKAFSKEMTNANKYLLNNIISGFKPTAKESKKSKRIIPFNNLLDSWWIKNKTTILSSLMNVINNNAAGILADAGKYSGPSRLEEKKKKFQEEAKKLRQGKQNQQEGMKEEEDEWEWEENEDKGKKGGGETGIDTSSSSRGGSSG